MVEKYRDFKARSQSHDFSWCAQVCEQAFSLWLEIWGVGFRRLGIRKDKINSDDFLGKKIHTLCYEDKPVALVLSQELDLSRKSHQHSSYFNNFPEEIMSMMRRVSNAPSTVLTYLTIHSAWRHRKTDLPISDLLFSLAIDDFKESKTENLVGYIRTDKTVHESFYRHGLETVASSEAYNVPVDFCYAQKNQASLSSVSGVRDLVFKMKNKVQYIERMSA